MSKRSFVARGTPDRLVSLVVGHSDFMSCELLAAALKRFRSFRILKCLISADELVTAVQQLTPDILLINSDLSDGPLSGLTAVGQLVSSNLKTRIVMIMDEETERELAVEAFRAGVSGIINKSASFQSLKKSIIAVYNGQIWASNSDLKRVLSTLQRTPLLRCVNDRGETLLSKREREIIPFVAEGLTNREISARLNVSEHTVKNHLFRIYEKIGISSRVELILFATTRHDAK